MTIDLEQFVGKECIIIQNDDRVFESVIEKSSIIDSYPYYCKISDKNITFTREGIYDRSYPDSHMTIKSIRLKTPMNSSELPESTIEKLAKVLSPDAVKYITGTEEYVTFMTEMLTKFVREQVGTLHSDNECELVTSMVCSKIYLSTVK